MILVGWASKANDIMILILLKITNKYYLYINKCDDSDQTHFNKVMHTDLFSKKSQSSFLMENIA